MAEMFTVRLCDEALDTEQEVEADAETTFQELEKLAIAEYHVEVEDSIRLAYHFDTEGCRQTRPFSRANEDGLTSLAGRNILVHKQPKSAYRRRLEDAREHLLHNVRIDIDFHYGTDTWPKSLRFDLPMSTRMKDLYIALKPAVIAFLATVPHEGLRRTAEKHLKPIWYTIGFLQSDIHDDWISADVDEADEHLNIDTLSDLFSDPNADKRLDVIVGLSITNQLYDDLSDIDEALEPRKTIQWYDFYRLGISSAQIDGAEPNETIFQIRTCDILIAWRNHGESERNLKLCTIPAYDFGDFCIGNSNDGDPGHYTEIKPEAAENYNYLTPFEQFNGRKQRSYAELKKRIAEYARDPKPSQVGSGVPFLPPYTFNAYDPAHYDIEPPRMPKTTSHMVNIQIAVRCVNYLVNENTRQPLIDFPQIVLTIRLDSTAGDICGSILSELDPEGTSDSSILFNEPYEGSWGMELWAMPQEPGEMKLYRFSAPDDDVGSISLSDLLSRRLVESGDCRLYFEAHIVPKDDTWLVTGRPYNETEVDEIEPARGVAKGKARGSKTTRKAKRQEPGDRRNGPNKRTSAVQHEEDDEDVEHDADDASESGGRSGLRAPTIVDPNPNPPRLQQRNNTAIPGMEGEDDEEQRVIAELIRPRGQQPNRGIGKAASRRERPPSSDDARWADRMQAGMGRKGREIAGPALAPGLNEEDWYESAPEDDEDDGQSNASQSVRSED